MVCYFFLFFWFSIQRSRGLRCLLLPESFLLFEEDDFFLDLELDFEEEDFFLDLELDFEEEDFFLDLELDFEEDFFFLDEDDLEGFLLSDELFLPLFLCLRSSLCS